MERISRIEDLRCYIHRRRTEGLDPVVLVPTMGAFHAGHRELMRRAKDEGGTSVVSLFINPLQFGPGEDYERYPRQATEDAAVAEEVGVTVFFTPTVEEMYPEGPLLTRVGNPEMSRVLCGAARPTHFEGVLTVVAKLLHIVSPDVALFGEKDRQQLVLIRRMARDLNFPVRVDGVPTVREADGLAMSSRNRYLSPTDRRRAPALYRALRTAKTLWEQGQRSADALHRAVSREIQAVDITPEYISLVDPERLEPWTGDGALLLAVAARVGSARLIDNVLLE